MIRIEHSFPDEALPVLTYNSARNLSSDTRWEHACLFIRHNNSGGFYLLTDIQIFLLLCFQLINTLLVAKILNTFLVHGLVISTITFLFLILVCNILQFLLYDVPILLCTEEGLKCCLSKEFH